MKTQDTNGTATVEVVDAPKADYANVYVVWAGAKHHLGRFETDALDAGVEDYLRDSYGSGRYVVQYRAAGKRGTLYQDNHNVAGGEPRWRGMIETGIPDVEEVPRADEPMPPSTDANALVLSMMMKSMEQQSAVMTTILGKLLDAPDRRTPANDLAELLGIATQIAELREPSKGSDLSEIVAALSGAVAAAKPNGQGPSEREVALMRQIDSLRARQADTAPPVPAETPEATDTAAADPAPPATEPGTPSPLDAFALSCMASENIEGRDPQLYAELLVDVIGDVNAHAVAASPDEAVLAQFVGLYPALDAQRDFLLEVMSSLRAVLNVDDVDVDASEPGPDETAWLGPDDQDDAGAPDGSSASLRSGPESPAPLGDGGDGANA